MLSADATTKNTEKVQKQLSFKVRGQVITVKCRQNPVRLAFDIRHVPIKLCQFLISSC